jgi:hypothetical protein
MIPKSPKYLKKSLFWHILGIFWAYLIPLNIIWYYFYFSFRKHSLYGHFKTSTSFLGGFGVSWWLFFWNVGANITSFT